MPKTLLDIHKEAMQEVQSSTPEEEMKRKMALLEAENARLKAILTSPEKPLVLNPNSLESGERVADYELKRLEEAASIRPLSLEEARIYDIMIRGKRTIKEMEKDNFDSAREVKSVPIDILIEAAKKNE